MISGETMGLLTLAALGGAAVMTTIAWYVIQVIARWRLFTKAGEAGWKSIIPFYNDYIVCKLSWKTSMFWVYLVLLVIGATITGSAAEGTFLNTVGELFEVGGAIVWAMSMFRLALSFGKSRGFGWGMVFLEPIFILILAFTPGQYQGPVDKVKEIE